MAALGFTVSFVHWPGANAQAKKSVGPSQAAARSGERAFASTCAGCHGLDGQGSSRAPNIAGSARVQHFTDTQIARIISNGIPGTGMPAFRTLAPERVRELVVHLRVLQGKGVERSLPGDAAKGKEIFFGKGECSACHAMGGAGGFLGPDLSAYAETTSPAAILEAILNPNRIVPAGYRSAVVTTHDGSRLEGVVRNEDNFSLQLQTKDGSFHFFQKAELQSVEYSSQSLMPTNYRERLNSAELSDLVKYLATTTSRTKTEASQEGDDMEEPH